MKILKEAYTIPDNVVMFYDRHLRLWTLYIKDEEGNQISNTEYTPSKADAIEMAQDVDNFVIRESLNEEILTEATIPQYRKILFSLIYYLTTNGRLKYLIDNECDQLQFHHIDSEYEAVRDGLKRAINSDASNIAIVTKNAHQNLTNLNNEIKQTKGNNITQQIKNKFEEVLKECSDEIFPLRDCLRTDIAQSIENIVANTNSNGDI